MSVLSLSPICAVLADTDAECDTLSHCDVCDDYICLEHSDAQFFNGDTDPMPTEYHGHVHRACLEFID